MDERPMLAMPSTGASGRRPLRLEDLVNRGWMLDTKMDGERAFSRYGRLVNRNGVSITAVFPEVSMPKDHWFDGEIVPLDGKFETILTRSQQSNPAKIKRLAEQHPCQFVAFDFLDRADEGHDYMTRRIDLERALDGGTSGHPITPVGAHVEFFKNVADLGMEGVIAKRPASAYRFGARSKDWIKFKVLHRISMVAIGYQLGNGHRAHFGSMKLALIGPEGPVTGPGEGWRVGSGFTEADTIDLKKRLDAGEFFTVEIEVLNRTSEGALRFPVYKGIRTDVPVHECLVDQVDALPTC